MRVGSPLPQPGTTSRHTHTHAIRYNASHLRAPPFLQPFSRHRPRFPSFCHRHPFDPAFVIARAAPRRAGGGKKARRVDRRGGARRRGHRKRWSGVAVRCGDHRRDVGRGAGGGKKICSRRGVSVRFGTRSTGNFQSAFRVSAFGGGEHVCVTLLADTGGFERKAHKYA